MLMALLMIRLQSSNKLLPKNAKTTLNKSMEEYDKATEQMEKMREYTLGTFWRCLEQ